MKTQECELKFRGNSLVNFDTRNFKILGHFERSNGLILPRERDLMKGLKMLGISQQFVSLRDEDLKKAELYFKKIMRT